jgi:hypothetical protein
MLAGVMSLMTMVSHSSRKCYKFALASSLGKPQNWFACTIVIRPVRSSSSSRVDSGPNRHVGNSGGGVVVECLGHSSSSGWYRGD